MLDDLSPLHWRLLHLGDTKTKRQKKASAFKSGSSLMMALGGIAWLSSWLSHLGGKYTKTKGRRKAKTTIKDENNSNDNRDGDGSWCDSPAPKLVVTLGW